jgi:hypothetical protein
MPNPDPRPTPPARQRAASQGRSRGRRPRPGPPGFTYEVQLLGGEAGRLLAQEQTEAIAALLAWLAAHPPMPTAATGPAATARAVGQSTAMPTGTRPAQQGQRMGARSWDVREPDSPDSPADRNDGQKGSG